MGDTIKVIVDGEEKEVESQELTVLVHQQDIRIDVPNFKEINSFDTIKCMQEMSEEAWQHISTGEIFRHFFHILFPKKIFKKVENQEASLEVYEIEIPSTIKELLARDYGIIHASGLIILICEATFEGKRVFLRNPENFLHPSVQANLVNMIRAMQGQSDKSQEAIP